MSLKLGSTNFGSLYLGSTKIGEAYLGSVKVFPSTPPDPYNPLRLPPYTMRFQLSDNVDPTDVTNPSWPSSAVWTQVSSNPNVWDFKYENSDWHVSNSIFFSLRENFSVLGANTAGVVNMGHLFRYAPLVSIEHPFDTSSVTNANYMFASIARYLSLPMFDFSNVQSIESMFNASYFEEIPDYDFSSVRGSITNLCQGCTSLKSVPDFTFTVNNLTNTDAAFQGCGQVESGALSMYNKLSASTGITSHQWTFGGCGSDTVTGAQELAQIPASWGGTMRAWQNDYYIEVIPTTLSRNVAFGKFYTNNVRQSVTSAQIKDGSWISLGSYTVDNLNNNANYVYMDIVDGFRAFFTKAADLTSLRYSSSGATVGVNITVYGKRVGSSSWSTVKTMSSTQGGTINITV